MARLPLFLGEGAKIYVCPPDGDWEPTAYGGAKYSVFGQTFLDLELISMGVAVAIPRIKDEGELWLGSILIFRASDGDVLVEVREGPPVIRVAAQPAESQIEDVCHAIYLSMEQLWPPATQRVVAGGQARIGIYLR